MATELVQLLAELVGGLLLLLNMASRNKETQGTHFELTLNRLAAVPTSHATEVAQLPRSHLLTRVAHIVKRIVDG